VHLVSKKLDYALRALTYMASREVGEVTLAREIAKVQCVPMHFLQKIMKEMVDQKILRSFHGPGGGYRLARNPSAITLKEVVEAVEGPICLIECVNGDPNCGIYQCCPQIPSWQSLHQQFVAMLAAKTLAELSGVRQSSRASISPSPN